MEVRPVGKESERFFGNVDVPDGGYVGNAEGKPIMRADYDDESWDFEGTALKSVPYIDLIADETKPVWKEGRIFYDEDEKTLALYNNESDVTLQMGQEQYIRATNKTGVTITNGQLVYIDGAQGSRPTTALAKADDPATCGVLAMATHDIEDNRTGFFTTFGLIHDLDTSLAVAGTDLYLSDSTAGDYTDTAPIAPNFPIHIGTILFSNASSGVVFLNIGPVDVCRSMVIQQLDINVDLTVNKKSKMTSIGGFAIRLTNKTGGVTVAGQLVKADIATDDAVVLTGAADDECFGVFLDSGIAADAEAWVVVSGIADVAMEDNTAATPGNWVETSSEAGYANATAGTPAAAPRHFREIGHCIESVSAGGGGTHILARCVLHFN